MGERLDLRNLPFLTDVNTSNNSGLACIQVDDEAAADAGAGIYAGWIKDAATGYSETCSMLYTLIPDANFEQALIDLGIADGGHLDGQVLTSNISEITFLIIPGEKITDLTGIADFGALEQLICNNNNLTSLDFSNNPNLTYLDCSNNELTAIHVTGSDNLTEFYCNDNDLSGSLNLMSNLSLEEFNGSNNPMLNCIEVTDATSADAGIGLYVNWVKDITANYSKNCAGIMARGETTTVENTGKYMEGEETAIAQSLKVYPNPVRDRLYIVASEDKTIMKITVYNLQGMPLLKTASNVIDVESLPEGIYFVGIQTTGPESMVYRKIIISGR